MVVVPRLFEVRRTRISKAIEKQGKLPAWLLDRAQAVGARDYERKARLIDMPMKLLLGRTLKPKIAKRFGGRMKAKVSGGAPLNPERSEERRGGNECVRTCKSRWSPDH